MAVEGLELLSGSGPNCFDSDVLVDKCAANLHSCHRDEPHMLQGQGRL